MEALYFYPVPEVLFLAFPKYQSLSSPEFVVSPCDTPNLTDLKDTNGIYALVHMSNTRYGERRRVRSVHRPHVRGFFPKQSARYFLHLISPHFNSSEYHPVRLCRTTTISLAMTSSSSATISIAQALRCWIANSMNVVLKCQMTSREWKSCGSTIT